MSAPKMTADRHKEMAAIDQLLQKLPAGDLARVRNLLLVMVAGRLGLRPVLKTQEGEVPA